MREYDALDRERFYGSGDDYRGSFGRDRDRVLYSSAFRRLAGKTQVVAVGELGDFHTRMTHSLKVAQLGRRLAQKLQAEALEAGITGGDYPIPDPELIEAACLAHDLGHPPFGHAGEQALANAVDDVALELRCPKAATPTEEEAVAAHEEGGFEGNAQTFRILVALSARHPRNSRGLDLTRATLDATIKYPWSRGFDGKPALKWNAYPQDLESASWVRHDAGWGSGARQSFEAQVMDWCDDVTYACHDVEDFYRAGVIPLDRLFAFPPIPQGETYEDDEPLEARPFFDFVAAKWAARGHDFNRDAARSAWRSLGQMIGIDEPYRYTRESKVAVQRSTSELITYFLGVTYRDGTAPCRYEGVLEVDQERRLRSELLQELIWYYVIARPALASQQRGQAEIVRTLLRIYALEDDGRLLPIDRREELAEHQNQLRAATDHVASLTEATAIALHHRLTGVQSGQLSDPVWRA